MIMESWNGWELLEIVTMLIQQSMLIHFPSSIQLLISTQPISTQPTWIQPTLFDQLPLFGQGQPQPDPDSAKVRAYLLLSMVLFLTVGGGLMLWMIGRYFRHLARNSNDSFKSSPFSEFGNTQWIKDEKRKLEQMADSEEPSDGPLS